MANGSGDDNIRIGSTERERAVAALAEHLSEGRLEVSEYDQRCGLAAAARTRGELELIFRDLPEPHPTFAANAPERVDAEHEALVEVPVNAKQNKLLIGGLVAFAVVAVTVVAAITGTWWALAPMLIAIALFALVS
jgi:hypothetical protein